MAGILFVNGFYDSEESRLLPWSWKERGVGFFHCIFYLMRHLKLLGHRVIYLGYIKEMDTPYATNEGIYEGVEFYDFQHAIDDKSGTGYHKVLKMSENNEIDAMVSVEVWDNLWVDLPNIRQKIAYVHNGRYGSIYKNRIEAPQLTDIVAVSDYHKDQLIVNHPVVQDKIHVIGHGLERSLFERPEERDPNSVIFAAGPHKGLESMGKIWPMLKERMPNLKLKISSSSTLYGFKEWEEEKRWKAELLQHPDIEDIGILPHHLFIRELQKVSAFLYPCSIPDTFGLGCIEAIASGTPVVAYDVGGNVKRIIEEWQAGTLVSNGSVIKFVDAVQVILQSPNIHDRYMAAASVILQSEKYSWTNIAKEWEKIVCM